MGTVGILGWIVAGGLVILAVTLWKTLGAIGDKLLDVETSLSQARGQLSAARQDAAHLEQLVAMAMPIVVSLDKETQSGEWKFHQAYAKLAPQIKKDKWRAGWAIHEALARIRMEKS